MRTYHQGTGRTLCSEDAFQQAEETGGYFLNCNRAALSFLHNSAIIIIIINNPRLRFKDSKQQLKASGWSRGTRLTPPWCWLEVWRAPLAKSWWYSLVVLSRSLKESEFHKDPQIPLLSPWVSSSFSLLSSSSWEATNQKVLIDKKKKREVRSEWKS